MIVPSHFVPLAAPGMVQMGLKMLLNPKSPFGFKFPPSPDQLVWSWRFMRACTPDHVSRHEVLLRDLNLESRTLYDEMTSALGIGFEWHKLGLLMLCAKNETLEHEKVLANRAVEIGVRAEVLNKDDLAAVDPSITMEAAGAVHFLDDGHLTPQNFVHRLRDDLAKRGVTMISESVTELKTLVNGVEVNGRFFDQVVLATGALSPILAKKIGLRLPMMAGKGYSFDLPNPPQMPKLCSILVEARVAVTPMTSGLRFAGTMEIGPPDQRVNPNRLSGIKESIPKFFPNFSAKDFNADATWLGHRPCSPDGIPYLGRVSGNNQVIIATGHSMMGMSLGPVTGKLVAEIASNQTQRPYLSLMDPNRYA